MTASTGNVPSRKPRPRRIAADEAHAWARNLRLNNPFAKLVLSMLTLYVQADGHCFVGIDALAEDTELSADTVRKRLAWLEGIGAIARFPQWVDANGRRNGDGNGRRTTDEIRLLLSADADSIERRALGDDSESPQPDKSDTIAASEDLAPPSQPGLNSGDAEGQDSVSPRPTLCQPSDSGKGLDSSNLEPEPEDSPLPPEAGGARPAGEGIESGPTWPHEASWQRLKDAWGDPILHAQIAQNLWTAFTEVERERFIRVVRGYLSWRLNQRNPPNRCNIQKLMREREAWGDYEKLAGPDPALRTFIVEGSSEHRALQVIARIGGLLDPLMTFEDTQGARGYWLKCPLRPDELAMSIFADKPIEQWTVPDRGTPSFNAWRDRLHEWLGKWRDPVKAPYLFPPRKDGSFPAPKEDTTGPPGEHAA